MSVKVSSKYQVVIPDQVRQALDLKPGTEVDVIAKGGVAYIVPVKPIEEVGKRTRKHLSQKDVASSREKEDRKI